MSTAGANAAFLLALNVLCTFACTGGGNIAAAGAATCSFTANDSLVGEQGSAYTQKDQFTNDASAAANGVVGYGSKQWSAFPFTAGSSYTLTAASAYLSTVGKPTSDYVAYIYSDSGSNAPGSAISGPSAKVPISAISSGGGWVQFNGLNASLTSDTKYWLVIKRVSGVTDWSNYVNWWAWGTGLASDTEAGSTDGKSWGSSNQYVRGAITTFGGAPASPSTP